MMTPTRTYRGVVAALAISSLAGGMAAAQEGDAQAQMDQLRQSFTTSMGDADWAALASLFSENATVLPVTGGLVEGRAAVQSYYEESGLTSADISPTKTETVGDGLTMEVGSFTVSLSEEMGGGSMDGEYVVLVEQAADGAQIRSLAAFPVRQAPAP